MKRVPERRAFKRIPLMAKLSPITARVADADSSVCALLDGYLGHHGFRVLSAPTTTSRSRPATTRLRH